MSLNTGVLDLHSQQGNGMEVPPSNPEAAAALQGSGIVHHTSLFTTRASPADGTTNTGCDEGGLHNTHVEAAQSGDPTTKQQAISASMAAAAAAAIAAAPTRTAAAAAVAAAAVDIKVEGMGCGNVQVGSGTAGAASHTTDNHASREAGPTNNQATICLPEAAAVPAVPAAVASGSGRPLLGSQNGLIAQSQSQWWPQGTAGSSQVLSGSIRSEPPLTPAGLKLGLSKRVSAAPVSVPAHPPVRWRSDVVSGCDGGSSTTSCSSSEEENSADTEEEEERAADLKLEAEQSEGEGDGNDESDGDGGSSGGGWHGSGDPDGWYSAFADLAVGDAGEGGRDSESLGSSPFDGGCHGATSAAAVPERQRGVSSPAGLTSLAAGLLSNTSSPGLQTQVRVLCSMAQGCQ